MSNNRPTFIVSWPLSEGELYDELVNWDDPASTLAVAGMMKNVTVTWRAKTFHDLKKIAFRLNISANDQSTHDELIRQIVGVWCAKVAEHRRKPQFTVGDQVQWSVIPQHPRYTELRVTQVGDHGPGVQVTETRVYNVEASVIRKIEAPY